MAEIYKTTVRAAVSSSDLETALDVTVHSSDYCVYKTNAGGTICEMMLIAYVNHPKRQKEGDDKTTASLDIVPSLIHRRFYELKFMPFANSGAAWPNTQTLEYLKDMLQMKNIWITACELSRWSDAANYPTLAALLPAHVYKSGESESLEEAENRTLYSATLTETGVM